MPTVNNHATRGSLSQADTVRLYRRVEASPTCHSAEIPVKMQDATGLQGLRGKRGGLWTYRHFDCKVLAFSDNLKCICAV